MAIKELQSHNTIN